MATKIIVGKIKNLPINICHKNKSISVHLSEFVMQKLYLYNH